MSLSKNAHIAKAREFAERRDSAHRAEMQSKAKSDLTLTFGDSDGQVVYVGTKITTVEELLEDAKVDLRIWEVSEVQVNNWETAGNRKLGQEADGKRRPEQLWKTGLRQIRVKLRRKAPKLTQDGILALLANFPKASVVPKPRPKGNTKHLLELSLVDVHLGKLAWSSETNARRQLDVMIDDYRHAVDDMIDRCAGFPIEKIVLPIGNDFYNVDNWAKTTARGTLVDCTDDPFQTVWKAGFQLIRDTVDRCRRIAPIHVVWVPGNHDPATSWYLSECVKTHFNNDSKVDVDNGNSPRKYMVYGRNLIGWHHGDHISLDKLASLMPVEAVHDWSRTCFRFIRVGHFHKAKQIRFINRDTSHGVEVSVIPSLSVTDRWHHENGYVGNLRTAECTLWHREAGHVATFTVEARSASVARKKGGAA
jgi:hypothetical protein